MCKEVLRGKHSAASPILGVTKRPQGDWEGRWSKARSRGGQTWVWILPFTATCWFISLNLRCFNCKGVDLLHIELSWGWKWCLQVHTWFVAQRILPRELLLLLSWTHRGWVIRMMGGSISLCSKQGRPLLVDQLANCEAPTHRKSQTNEGSPDLRPCEEGQKEESG